MGKLILVRHGQSQWNAKNIWTGLTDIPLSEKGREEAKQAAKSLQNLQIDTAYTSSLSRAQETLDIILQSLGKSNIPVVKNAALNERDYGDYTGKNKLEIKEQVGDEEFFKIRRGWNTPIPHGETLKDVYDRVVPYFEEEILPKLKKGETILVTAHGNSLRALIKYLEHISDDDIAKVEIGTCEVLVYNIDDSGNASKQNI
ncbi:MAG TPA: 2,3-diphosphoglycerate-dependent phosphoglycerate mutase [Candidatus Saccharimonadales bacterium]|nr:2,3-diphosphoglycerate-dependent phosphoglycerate mutase [Candidatus Saccharimonadales bacterium]